MYCLLLVAMYVFRDRNTPIPRFTWLVPLTNNFNALIAICTAVLAWGRYKVMRDPTSYWIGAGFWSAAVALLLWLLSWPGLTPGGHQVLGHTVSTSAYATLCLHIIMGLNLLAAVLIRHPKDDDLAGWRWAVGTLGWAFCTLAVASAIVTFDRSLPVLVRGDGSLTPLCVALGITVVLLNVTGAAASAEQYRRSGDDLLSYAAIVQSSIAFTFSTALLTANRYNLWLLLARFVTEWSFLVLIFGLLADYVHLFGREKQKTEALRESEAQFHTLGDSIPQLTWMANADGWIFWYNRRWYEYTGTTPAHMEGWGWQSVHDPTELPKVLERWRASIDGGQPFEMVFPLRGADGVFRPFLTRVLPMKNADGTVIRWFGTNTDISEQKKTEQVLRRQAELLRLSFDAVIVWRLDEGIETWNRGAERLYGFAESDALDRATHDLLQTVFPKPLPKIESELKDKGYWEGELQHVTRDGRTVTVLTRWQLLHDSTGIDRVLEINRDISERKRADQDLRDSEQRYRDLSQQLDMRVRQRTAQLQAVNKELEAFSYSVSHDLRAPLRTLEGFSQALLGSASGIDGKSQHYLDRIRAATQRMRNLIDGLLQLSRTTRAELQLSNVNLSDLANSIAEELRTTEPERNVQIHVEPGLGAVGDARLLGSALQNLIGNAWKYTAQRDPAIIEFGRMNHGSSATFFVRDNGAGFDMNQGEKLFTPFQRLHRESEFQGTGIGLANVQRIIARHHGRIWAEATPEQGATFYFELGKVTSD